jgi:NAD(P)-dependent dehydrogenase (short-subunit alcohol dehydrogenase family)
VRDAASRSRLEKLGVQAQAADMTSRAQIAALARALKDQPLDVLVCNAGISGRRGMALGSFDFDSWEEVLRVNLLGPAALVEALADNVAASLAPRGIVVVALSPGWVRTDMGGAGAPLSPQASVTGLRKVIAALKPADSGRFLSYDGSSIPW